MIGLNRVGMDGKGLHYVGERVTIDPKGQPLVACGPGNDRIVTATFDAVSLVDFREKFPVGKEADDFELRG